MANKITKKDYFGMLLKIEEVQNNEELVKFINREIELLNRKKSSTKTSEENELIKVMILDAMQERKEPVTVTELLENEKLSSYITKKGDKLTNQKISALMTQLKNANMVVNFKDKKKSLFKLFA